MSGLIKMYNNNNNNVTDIGLDISNEKMIGLLVDIQNM